MNRSDLVRVARNAQHSVDELRPTFDPENNMDDRIVHTHVDNVGRLGVIGDFAGGSSAQEVTDAMNEMDRYRWQAAQHPDIAEVLALQVRTIHKLYDEVTKALAKHEVSGKAMPRPTIDESSKPRGLFRENAGTFVYIARDKNAEIIYVGVTDDLFGRMASHKASGRWWHLKETLEWTEYPDRVTALKQEAKLIKRYEPEFNIAHNPSARRRTA